MDNYSNLATFVILLVFLAIALGYVIIIFVPEPWQTYLFYSYVVTIVCATHSLRANK